MNIIQSDNSKRVGGGNFSISGRMKTTRPAFACARTELSIGGKNDSRS